MKKLIITILIAAFAILLVQCGGSEKKAGKEIELLGAGASFPYPLYSKMFSEYYKGNSIKVNYQAIGSGGGIRQLTAKTIDFGGTDAFMKGKDLAEVESEILHMPTCIGAVSITYNLKNNPVLNLTSDIITDIYLGKINNWNAPAIQKLNKNVELPDQKITVIHRSDGSGTSFVFTDYLSKVSTEWKTKVGAGKSLSWPVGLGGKGNPGVAGLIKQIYGSIGYVELIYAEQNGLPVAKIQNKNGNFIRPSLHSSSLSAQIDIPEDTRVTITNTDAPEGYPISSFTWLIFYEEQSYNNRSKENAETLVNLLTWMIHEGQKYSEQLGYAPLPMAAVEKSVAILKKVKFNGINIVK